MDHEPVMQNEHGVAHLAVHQPYAVLEGFSSEGIWTNSHYITLESVIW